MRRPQGVAVAEAIVSGDGVDQVSQTEEEEEEGGTELKNATCIPLDVIHIHFIALFQRARLQPISSRALFL